MQQQRQLCIINSETVAVVIQQHRMVCQQKELSLRNKNTDIFLLDIFGSYAQMSQFRSPMMVMYPGGYPVTSSPNSMMDPMSHHHHQQQESSAVTSGAA